MSLDLSMLMRDDAHLERPRRPSKLAPMPREAASPLRLLVAAVVVTLASLGAAVLVATDEVVAASADATALPPCVDASSVNAREPGRCHAVRAGAARRPLADG